VIVNYYTEKSESEKERHFQNKLNNIVEFVNYKYSALFALLTLFVFYLIIFLFKIPMTIDTRPAFIFITEMILWIIFFVCLLNIFFYRVFDFSLIQKISNWIKELKSKDDGENTITKITTDVTVNKNTSGNGNISGNTTTTTTTTAKTTTLEYNNDSDDDYADDNNTKEVYNVSNNLYDYEEAQAICKSYGAKIATYDQIEEAYDKGGEWCNYGWSEGQMIYFPTQKDTWNKLQESDSTKNNCGRPGINGGYMSNPYLKFGVNCYGVKPSPTDADLAEMKAQREQIYATSKEDKELNDKVEYWKKNADKLLNLNSFNNNKWSEF
jgi:hypothetical protein